MSSSKRRWECSKGQAPHLADQRHAANPEESRRFRIDWRNALIWFQSPMLGDAIRRWSIPVTWVTVKSVHIGNTSSSSLRLPEPTVEGYDKGRASPAHRLAIQGAAARAGRGAERRRRTGIVRTVLGRVQGLRCGNATTRGSSVVLRCVGGRQRPTAGQPAPRPAESPAESAQKPRRFPPYVACHLMARSHQLS